MDKYTSHCFFRGGISPPEYKDMDKGITHPYFSNKKVWELSIV